jgi:Zn-dependent peptidase ImmA (M78 family)
MTTPIPLWGKSTTELEIYGERLRDARLIQRYKAQDVAKAADMLPDRYSRLEHSLASPVDAQRARKLANALDFSVEFLTAPPVTPVQRGSLLFRAKKSMTRGEEDQLVSWARLIGDLLQRSVEEDVRLPITRIPRITEARSPEKAAAMTRQVLGIESEQPIPHLIRALERSGVYVAAIDFSAELHAKNHDAFSTWIGQSLDWPLVVVRISSSWERTRLSTAHELGHIVMHQIRRDGDLESEAYRFAAEFLFPKTMLFDAWPRQTTLVSLLPLKRAWGMSLSGLIEHGYRNGLINSMQRTNLYKQLSNRRDHATGERWRIQEPGWKDREPERPKLIAKVSEVAFGSDASLKSIANEVYHWRADFIQRLLVGQVTGWASAIAATAIDQSAPVASLRDRQPSLQAMSN